MKASPLLKPSGPPSRPSLRPIQGKSPLDFICMDFKRKIPLLSPAKLQPHCARGTNQRCQCLFLNHLITKGSPFTCRTQSIKPPKTFYFFSKK